MKVLFAGTPDFAVKPLIQIARNFPICGVLTSPDKSAGRGRDKKALPPVKKAALELSLPVFQPEILDENFQTAVRELKPDILVVAAYHKIFRKNFLEIFPQGGLNIHPSLLPKYRGPSPIQAAILAGDRETGVTIQALALKMDEGDIFSQKRIALNGTETSLGLTLTASEIGAELIVDVLKDINGGKQKGIPQNHKDATYCRIIKKEDGLINWNNDAEKIERMIRAYIPWPRAYTVFKGLNLYFLQGGVYLNGEKRHNRQPGFVLGLDKQKGILIQSGYGILNIERLQLQAKRALFWKDFINGQKDLIGYKLGG
jgi:methionyl-tRNA formyltransferase